MKTEYNNPISRPAMFYKYVSSFRKILNVSVHSDANVGFLTESGEVDEAVAKHFGSVYNNFSTGAFHPDFM